MVSSKYARLSNGGGGDTTYNSIFTYATGGRQSWSKKSSLEGGDYYRGEDDEWRNTENFCDIAANWFIVCICYIFVAFSFPFSLIFCLKIISNYETLVIFRLGKLQRLKGPGPAILLPCIDQYHRIDLRMRVFPVPPQTVLLRDGSGVEIGADVYLRTCDPVKATLGVQSLDASVKALAKTTLINACMPLSLGDLTADTQILGSKLQKLLNEACIDWGCEVGQVVLSKPKVLQEPREEARHPGFSQLTQFLSGFTKDGGGNGAAGGLGGGGGVNAILQQLAPHLANATVAQVPALGGADAALKTEVVGATAADSIPSPTSGTVLYSSSSSSSNQIEELANLFLGVLSGVLSEKLVRSINSTYEVTLENVDGIGEEKFLFFLDLKRGLGSVGQGPLPAQPPDAWISLPASRFPALLKGQLSIFHAYMCGDLKVKGDTSAALKLEEVVTLMTNQIGKNAV